MRDKNNSIKEDIFIETLNTNTMIVNVDEIVKGKSQHKESTGNTNDELSILEKNMSKEKI